MIKISDSQGYTTRTVEIILGIIELKNKHLNTMQQIFGSVSASNSFSYRRYFDHIPIANITVSETERKNVWCVDPSSEKNIRKEYKNAK